MQIYVDNTDTLVFTTGRVLVLQWRSRVSVEGMEYVQRAYDDLRKRHRLGLFLFTVVGDAPIPDKAARRSVAEFMRRGNGVFVASVAAYTATGLRASLVRQVAFGLALLAGTTYRHEPCHGIDAAVKWLEAHANIQDGEELRACLAAMGVTQ